MCFRKIVLVILSVIAFTSCGGDDDICDSGEGTPRVKIKFKNVSQQLLTLDSLYVNVDYGNTMVEFEPVANVDSIFLPLRVDESTFTDMYFKTSKGGETSLVKLNYTSEPKYVSPACGVKLNYNNMDATIINNQVVKGVEINQNSIVNEDIVHLYLVF